MPSMTSMVAWGFTKFAVPTAHGRGAGKHELHPHRYRTRCRPYPKRNLHGVVAPPHSAAPRKAMAGPENRKAGARDSAAALGVDGHAHERVVGRDGVGSGSLGARNLGDIGDVRRELHDKRSASWRRGTSPLRARRIRRACRWSCRQHRRSGREMFTSYASTGASSKRLDDLRIRRSCGRKRSRWWWRPPRPATAARGPSGAPRPGFAGRWVQHAAGNLAMQGHALPSQPLSDTPFVVTAPSADVHEVGVFATCGKRARRGGDGVLHGKPAQVHGHVHAGRSAGFGKQLVFSHLPHHLSASNTGPSMHERRCRRRCRRRDRHAPTPQAMRYSIEIWHGTPACAA